MPETKKRTFIICIDKRVASLELSLMGYERSGLTLAQSYEATIEVMYREAVETMEKLNPSRGEPETAPFAEPGFLIMRHLRDISTPTAQVNANKQTTKIITGYDYRVYIREAQRCIDDLKILEGLTERYMQH